MPVYLTGDLYASGDSESSGASATGRVLPDVKCFWIVGTIGRCVLSHHEEIERIVGMNERPRRHDLQRLCVIDYTR